MARWVARWARASAFGMGGVFAAFDLIGAVWGDLHRSLSLEVSIGGLVVGFLQYRILRSHFDRAIGWVPACVLGWALAAGTVVSGPLLHDLLPGRWAAFAVNLGAILLGGVVLGIVTGGSLMWILRRRARPIAPA